MCKPHTSIQREAAPATGPTTRLNDGEFVEAQNGTLHARSWRTAHFPWWTLWLIWPLIGLAKAVAPTLLGAIGAVSQWYVPLLPVLLIVLGAALLLARRRDS
jgi:hypothetical protein